MTDLDLYKTITRHYSVFTLMLYPIIIRLRDAYKLTVVALGPHHPSMIQFFHRGKDSEAVE